jgi:hypothetical protein
MKQTKTAARAAFAIGLAITALQIDSHPAEAATVIKQSNVCKAGTDKCTEFFSTGTIPVVASYAFKWTMSVHHVGNSD